MLCKVLLLSILLHLCYGQAEVTISITAGGTATSNAKLDDAVTITCTYSDAFDGTYETGTLDFKKTSGAAAQRIIANGGEFQEPWLSSPNKYEVTYAARGELPYYMRVSITGVSMADSGEYICGIYDNGNSNLIDDDKAEVSVAANVAEVKLTGVEDGYYKVLDDGAARPVICTAYNGSKPSLELIIEGVDQPIVFPNVNQKTNADEYEGTVYYTFKPDQNDKEIKCKATVPGYENDAIITRATIKIQARPQISCPSEVEGNVGEDVKIECEITGNPLPDRSTVEWRVASTGFVLKAGTSSANLGLTSSIKEEGDMYRVVLQITIADHSYGEYSLGAENPGGFREETILVSKPTQKVVDDGGNGAALLATSVPLLLVSLVL